MNPLVSVIIPVYNGEAFLREALDSVFAQDYSPLEVIVADDGSTDSSAAIAESFEGVTCLRLGREGVSRARNLAVEASRGEFLAFLDADDVWMPGKTASQVALAQAHPEAGFVLCHRVHKFEGEVPPWFHGPIDGSPSRAFEPSSWLVRRSAFEEVGPFDEKRSVGEDTEWLARAWDLGMAHAMDQGVFLIRRIHDSNATSLVPRRLILDILRESVGWKRQRADANNA